MLVVWSSMAEGRSDWEETLAGGIEEDTERDTWEAKQLDSGLFC